MAASSSVGPVTVIPLPRERHGEAALVLAEAFADNPLHVAAFGRGALARNQRFFGDRLARPGGTWLAACIDEAIAGVVHWRVEVDRDANDANDEAEHVTLGPIGVRPAMQRRGIGTRLMDAYCAGVDERQQAGYLESDQLSNLEFYRRFGFEATGEFTTQGVLQYVMWRPALL